MQQGGPVLYKHQTIHNTQANQAAADLSTDVSGTLTSTIITICLVNADPILPSNLRSAQVKTLWSKSVCLKAAEQDLKTCCEILRGVKNVWLDSTWQGLAVLYG